MKAFNAHGGATRLVSISKLLHFGLSVILFSISTQAISTPLPFFSDPNMQACFDEQALANNWLQAEDVDTLLCPKKNITDPIGIEQLSNLIELDLSHNPIDHLPPLFAQAQTLKQLNLSGTSLYDLVFLFDLTQLTHLTLNDVSITMTPANPSQIQQQLIDTLRNNPGISHLGLNGFALTDPYMLFNELSLAIVSLELSDTGLQNLPMPFDQFSQLEILDLSHNPLDNLPPLLAQAQTLKQLNLSGTTLYDLVFLFDLTQLTHLTLNDVSLTMTPANPSQIQQQLIDTLRNNPSLNHLGLNSFELNDPYALFNELSQAMVSLELSDTGLQNLPMMLDQYTQLEVLDLSHNPIDYLPSLFAQAQTLKQLNLSGTALYDLVPLFDLRQLTHLWLNDVSLTMTPANPSQVQQQLTDVVRDNPGIRHLGLNGFALTNPYALFNEFSLAMVSLELSNTGLSNLPMSLDQYTQLEVLDLSHNPIDYLPPLFAQAQTLKQLNLSGTALYDLVFLFDLRQLTHLWLNDVSLTMAPANPSQIQQQLIDVLRDNPGIRHLGLNSFAMNDPYALFNELPLNLASLALSNTGLSNLPMSLDQFTQLEVLDLSHNPIDHLPPLFAQAQTLKQLNLSGTALYDLVFLFDLRQLTHLSLNDVSLTMTPADPLQIQQQLTDVVRDNPGIRHLGLNGFALTDAYALFNEFSLAMVSLELSNTGLQNLPMMLDQFTQLEILDLSHNPIDNLPPMFAQAQTLKQLNLSGTALYDLVPLFDLRQLTHLMLNDVTLTMTPSDPLQIQQQLTDLVRDNLGIRHLGLNGFALTSPYMLFNEMSHAMVSLELSNTGLQYLPVPLDQFTQLEILDLSHNPIDNLPPMFAQAQTLKQLNLSGTALYDLVFLFDLTQLTHLTLNDVSLTMTPANPSQIQQQLIDALRNNPGISHLGLNGFALTDPYMLFNELSHAMVSLELSNTGLLNLPMPLDQFTQLEVLDLSHNPIDNLPPMFAQAQTLKQLNLSSTALYDLVFLFDLQQLTHLTLNDVSITMTPANPIQIQQQLTDAVRNNPGITHLGLNGFALTDPYMLFNELSHAMVSLELSNTGLSNLPMPLDQFTQLEVLDLSNNPIDYLGPLFALQDSLKTLNLSNTNLSNLDELLPFTSLTHLFLNSSLAVTYSTQTLNQILLSNPSLTHVGLSGIQLQFDLDLILNTLAGAPVVWLEIANVAASNLAMPMPLIERLEYLDVSSNNLATLWDIGLAQRLESLIFADNGVTNIDWLLGYLPALSLVNLSSNDAISCNDLDMLSNHFGDTVELIKPVNCVL